jgi:hypothetical protein
MIRSRDYASFRKGKSIFFTMTKRKELCMLATDPHGPKQTLEHSLKIPWRPTKCIVQVKLVHPFLALHSLPALARCHVRSANHLSEHTKRTLSRRHRGPGKFSTCASIPGVRCGESFFRHLPENKTLLCALGVSAVNTRLLILAQCFQSHFHRLVHCSGHDEQNRRKGQDNQKPLPHGHG